MGVTDWLKERADRLVEAHLGAGFRETTRALAVRQNEYGYDPFGFHRDSLKYVAVLAEFLYRRYFRCHTYGLEDVPSGRVLLVANHSGQLPFDALCIVSALVFDAAPPRMVRSMLEKYVPTMPFVSYLFAFCGKITGTTEN